MSRRVVIITEIIAPYRIPVFNALARQDGIHLHVIFLSRTDASMRQWRVYEDEIKFSYEVLPSWRKRIGKYNLLLNQNVVTALRSAGPDVIVCGGYNYLASWQAMHWANRNGVQFLLWSESTARDQRGQRMLVESLKKIFFGRCDAFVVPGKSALDYLEQMGVPAENIFIARNAVDIDLFSEIGRKSRAEAARARTGMALPALDIFCLSAGWCAKKECWIFWPAIASYRRTCASRSDLCLRGTVPCARNSSFWPETFIPEWSILLDSLTATIWRCITAWRSAWFFQRIPTPGVWW